MKYELSMRKYRHRPEHLASATQRSPKRPGPSRTNRLFCAAWQAAVLANGVARVGLKPQDYRLQCGNTYN
jgi:hypothetical protein